MPSARREPGSDADGREADVEHERRATPSAADADDAAGAGRRSDRSARDQPAAISKRRRFSRARATARSRPMAAEAPELTRAESAWRDAARSLVRRLHVGLSRRWRPARQGRRFDLRRTLRASLQTGGEALYAAVAAPPAAHAAIRAARRRQPLDERPRADGAAGRRGHGEHHHARRGLHVLDGAPARDRRRAARGRGRDAPPRVRPVTRGVAARASARACASSCGGSASASWGGTPS